jgi:hypothetical protein
MRRSLQPELLDSLSPQHPDALHSRRDLRVTNRLMGNYRWFARTLPPLLRPGERTLELGAGVGELAEALGRRGVAADALDLWAQPDSWPASRTWHRADLRTFDDYGAYAALAGNLIFHHFDDGQLAALGVRLRASARVIVACEPLRRRSSQFLFRFVGTLLGANHVTLHDGHVSIAAGFAGDELPRALGLAPSAWDVRCRGTFLGAYRMIAVRRS